MAGKLLKMKPLIQKLISLGIESVNFEAVLDDNPTRAPSVFMDLNLCELSKRQHSCSFGNMKDR